MTNRTRTAQRTTHVSNDQIRDYWNERASSYATGVYEEIIGEKYPEWVSLLKQRTAALRAIASNNERAVRVLDIGCGPGFFSIIFAQMGCEVTALDASPEMLQSAAANALRAHAEGISFVHSDAQDLPFDDGSFDLIVSRNVTWLMRDPHAAYEEWRRVLDANGELIVFDANWYRYLVDPIVNLQREMDQAPSAAILGWDEEAIATQEQETRCERIALDLPNTYHVRPEWDMHALHSLGFHDLVIDESVWETLWTTGEQKFYGSSPLFMIHAKK